MQAPFTNVHLHVFDTDCAPDRFLRVIPSKPVRMLSKPIKNLLEMRWIRKGVHALGKKIRAQSPTGKYLAFLDIGLEVSQLNIFEKVLAVGKQYDTQVRLVGLTLNMDYMDSLISKGQKSFDTQLQEVMQIKEYYPDNFFPFLCVDPRHKSGVDLLNWAKKYFESGFLVNGTIYPYFYGIKLYPSLGFFPFDIRLEELYDYADKNAIPIMTHCTRSGSLYIGEYIESLIPKEPNFLSERTREDGSIPQPIRDAKKNILDRIKTYYDKGWIKNSSLGENDMACDLFGHPENYIPVLDRFPTLKICLAHLGGSNEILSKPDGKELRQIREVDGALWSDRIVQMMKDYPNLYTDISYTLSDLNKADKPEIKAKILSILADPNLADRLLFGTDYFMTEQEQRESDLYQIAKDAFSNAEFDLITRANPQSFLRV